MLCTLRFTMCPNSKPLDLVFYQYIYHVVFLVPFLYKNTLVFVWSTCSGFSGDTSAGKKHQSCISKYTHTFPSSSFGAAHITLTHHLPHLNGKTEGKMVLEFVNRRAKLCSTRFNVLMTSSSYFILRQPVFAQQKNCIVHGDQADLCSRVTCNF